jgi:Protein of unknown function (DUF3891)
VLLRRDDEGVLAIGQLSHAWLSGQLARAWGNDRFPSPEPREEIAFGAQQHDIGWARFDLDPGISPESGLPRSFLETSVEEHLAIWGAAPDCLLSASEHAALVVSLHGCALSELRLRTAAGHEVLLNEHIAVEHARQARLQRRLGLSEERVRLIQRQMWTWDALSLALCHGWHPFTIHGVPECGGLGTLELRAVEDTSTVVVHPWPFSSPVLEVRCEGHRLADSYEDEAAMKRGLEGAPPLTLRFRLVATLE